MPARSVAANTIATVSSTLVPARGVVGKFLFRHSPGGDELLAQETVVDLERLDPDADLLPITVSALAICTGNPYTVRVVRWSVP